MASPGSRPILIVDDDPAAVELTKRALARAGIQTRIEAVKEGEEAIAYLKARMAEGDDALPLLLFLDLTMPGTAGFQVLDWIRNQPRLRRALTVVLSSSPHSRAASPAGAKLDSAKYPMAADTRTLFELSNAMLTVDEIERLVLPAIPQPTTTTS